MNLDRILQPGMSIEILFGSQEGRDKVWQAHVQASRADTFLIAAPEFMDQAILAPVGREVVVWAGLDNARCCFDSMVLSELVKDGNILLELKKPQKLRTSDRRNFVRMESRLPIKFAVVGPEALGKWKSVEPSTSVHLQDLSGVGLSFGYHREFPPETRLVIDLPLELKHAALNIRILATVVRSELQGESVRVGVSFDNVSELQQDLIMKHLFYTMRKQIQISREDF